MSAVGQGQPAGSGDEKDSISRRVGCSSKISRDSSAIWRAGKGAGAP